jgi:hypothetical protein
MPFLLASPVTLDANGDPIVTAAGGVLVRHYGRKALVSENAVKGGLGSIWDPTLPWPLPTRSRMQQNAHCELEVTLPKGSNLPLVCS